MQAVLRLTLSLTLALVPAASAAGQAIIAEDNFNAYPLGSINLLGHGTGWGGTFWFGHPGVTVVNGLVSQVARVGTDGEQFQARYIVQTPHAALVENGLWGKDGTSLSFGFDLRRVPGTNSSYGGVELRALAFSQVRLGAVNPQGELGVHHLPSGQIATIPGTSADVPVRMVARFDYVGGGELVRVWVNPAAFPPTAPPDLTSSIPNHRWDLLQLSAGTSTTGGYDIDNLEFWDASGWSTNVPQLGAIPPSGGSGSLADVSGVSAAGDEIAGTSLPLAPGQPEAFLWREGLGSSGLGALPGDIASRAHGVSDDGSTVVGVSYPNPSEIEAWRWNATLGQVGLGFLPGHVRSTANAASGDGSIVVGSSSSSTSPMRAVRWDAVGNIIELPALAGHTESDARGVSSDGTTIVGISRGLFGRAVAWHGGAAVDLGWLPGDSFSVAHATSADGSVIVGASGNLTANTVQAFAWTAAGMIGLGTLPGDVSTRAVDVSGDGRIIVGNSIDAQGSSRPFLRSAQTGMVELQTYLAGLGTIGLAGWDLGLVTGISADGTTFIGVGVDPTGADAGWRVVIPPSGAPTIGTTNCTPGALNSTGVAGQLTATGSAIVAHNDVTLHATWLPPNSFGYFLGSRVLGARIAPPGSLGNLCLTGSIGRYSGAGQIQNSGAGGAASLALDLTQTPQPNGFVSVAAGETWHFQMWHRDAIGGSVTSAFTRGITIQF